jgi:hypothetical protein
MYAVARCYIIGIKLRKKGGMNEINVDIRERKER